uniref:Uncharacterized protein n=1 Tax=Candidatus Kentrum sp. MB TaxID=2138164 RepID=A0A450Y0E4_9GAMM|nr:MAG: hypothetical protein BECKMB1821I_GA0114274_10956 [Candidatus Kentron sp. MB]VFK77154.1 MAG: hypothetical protein BECKMB1821H_GA0114242_11046 [Candidatus Kentron sp. MB]
MLENGIFGQWLDTEAQRVLGKLHSEQPLTLDDKLIIILKGQENHFRHLDIEVRQEMIVTRDDMDRPFNRTDEYTKRINKYTERIDEHIERLDKDIERKDKQFEQMDKRFEATINEIRQLYQSSRSLK